MTTPIVNQVLSQGQAPKRRNRVFPNRKNPTKEERTYVSDPLSHQDFQKLHTWPIGETAGGHSCGKSVYLWQCEGRACNLALAAANPNSRDELYKSPLTPPHASMKWTNPPLEFPETPSNYKQRKYSSRCVSSGQPLWEV